MILFRCECGALYQVDDEFAGGNVECRDCGNSVSVPAESDPAIVLIYKSGGEEEGNPMLREEIPMLLAAGELTEAELYWDGTTWKPIAELAGIPDEEKESFQIRQDVQMDEDEEEIDFEDMGTGKEDGDEEEEIEIDEGEPLVQKVQIEDTGKKSKKAKKKKKAKEPKTPKEPKEAGRLRKKLLFIFGSDKNMKTSHKAIIQTFWFIVVVLLGYKLGVGPVISGLRKTPSYVLIHNKENIDYKATLGIKRLSAEVVKNNTTKIEVFIRPWFWPEQQTLKLTPLEPGAGKAFKVSVPIRTGEITTVNLKKNSVFGIFDSSKIWGKKIAADSVKKLTKEIAERKAPKTAVKVNREIRDLVKKAFAGKSQELIYSSIQYQFKESALGNSLTAWRELQDRRKKKKEKKKEKIEYKPELLSPPSKKIYFTGGSGVYNAFNEDYVDRAISLPGKTFRISTFRTIKLSSDPQLLFSGDDKILKLKMKIDNQYLSLEGKKFKGTWEYEANCPLEGKNKGVWDWKWKYYGSVWHNKRTYTLSLDCDKNGRERKSVKSK